MGSGASPGNPNSHLCSQFSHVLRIEPRHSLHHTVFITTCLSMVHVHQCGSRAQERPCPPMTYPCMSYVAPATCTVTVLAQRSHDLCRSQQTTEHSNACTLHLCVPPPVQLRGWKSFSRDFCLLYMYSYLYSEYRYVPVGYRYTVYRPSPRTPLRVPRYLYYYCKPYCRCTSTVRCTLYSVLSSYILYMSL